ncbi:hypothetical protein [Luteimonas aquatica]|uniref:hypothetical protein n=1 Tax=Luteimonas aquatica TaxID=450364 RepID=UPI001F574663|nr:hypothetical protein [Luteimonas aquatica]
MHDDAPAPGKVLTLRPSKLRWVLMLAGTALLLALSARLLQTNFAIGLAGTVFFALCTLVAALNLLPGASFLRLDAEGFEMRALFRSHRVAWREVAGFGVARIALNRVVGWHFAAGHAGHPHLRKLNAGLSGFEAALPDTYGRKAQALAELMNAWRDAAP